MDIKKAVGWTLGIGGTVASALFLKKALPKEVADVAVKAVTESEKNFGGVPLSKLNDIAKAIDPRNWVSLDQWGFLVLHYRSNRGHQTFTTQLDLDDALKLVNLNGGPVFPGQRYSHAGEFVKRVNEALQFTKPRE